MKHQHIDAFVNAQYHRGDDPEVVERLRRLAEKVESWDAPTRPRALAAAMELAEIANPNLEGWYATEMNLDWRTWAQIFQRCEAYAEWLLNDDVSIRLVESVLFSVHWITKRLICGQYRLVEAAVNSGTDFQASYMKRAA